MVNWGGGGDTACGFIPQSVCPACPILAVGMFLTSGTAAGR